MKVYMSDTRYAPPEVIIKNFIFGNLWKTETTMVEQTESANEGVLEIICSTAARKPKLDMMPGGG